VPARAALGRGRDEEAMTRRLAVLAHEPETGLGTFAAQLDAEDVEYDVLSTTAGLLPDHARFDGAVALGGSLDADDARLLEARRWIRNAVRAGMPFLGICLGGQLLASALGAAVRWGRPEVGVHDIFLTDAAEHDPLFAGLPRRFEVLGWHEHCFDLPRGAVPLAGSIACTHQAFRFGVAAYGLQFHPEVRADELVRWRGVPGYRELAERTGTDVDAVTVTLRRAAPQLDAVAEQLLERWLYLVSGVATFAPPLHAAV
jgi:GMP synthase-like glutamine amidotransferase